jgi:general stress protein 26
LIPLALLYTIEFYNFDDSGRLSEPFFGTMKARKMSKSSTFLFFLLVLFPFLAMGQHSATQDSSRNHLISIAKEIMESAGICALTSLDTDGLPRVRPMDAFLPENYLTVWFGTNAHSRKVQQIKGDPRVSLYYFDRNSGSYVLIQGMATLVDDPVEKERRWKKEWEAFYPNKEEDYLLIKVSPVWMELISEKLEVFGDQKTWAAPRVVF